jgi:hypothetical protein
MTHPLDNDAREQEARAEQLRAKVAAAQLRKDVQTVLGTEQGRRLVWLFLQTAAIDVSPLRADPVLMAHAVGWQDAGSHWINLIRSHCPEREAQMRAEAKRDAQRDEAPNDD